MDTITPWSIKMKIIALLALLSLKFLILAHEGHHHAEEANSGNWIEQIGSFHLIFLHFPIALINMAVLAEILSLKYPRPIFEYSSRFMLAATAILAPLTTLFGYIYSYSAPYDGLMGTLLQWHMWLGILTSLFAIAAMTIKFRYGNNRIFYICLAFLFCLVNFTAFFGGEMTFGPFVFS